MLQGSVVVWTSGYGYVRWGRPPGRVKSWRQRPAEVAVCLANVGGRLAAMDNWCPHRRGPLGQGWVEGEAVVCPWHSWAFSTITGVAEPPERANVDVFPLKVEGEDLFVNLR